MPHGFLSYNFPVFGMRDESMAGIKIGIDYMNELFSDIPTEEKELSDLMSSINMMSQTSKTVKSKSMSEDFISSKENKTTL